MEKKLCRLSSFLKHASNEFENAAGHTTEEDIKMSIRAIETIIKQYMKELQSQLAILRVTHCRQKNNKAVLLSFFTTLFFVVHTLQIKN